ncbi:hypothetical protein BHM03_00035035 [Ensete ventricosum]|uniref:Uncharacterized protein n=1 Tax=Ensete ventricosum TaxID=4639 RepID=A0A445MJA1_ENSVE|nr:hypothetical protein BHM03_00035035 [Ensete ventricosum]
MRLNRVKLFYAFVAAIGSESSAAYGRGASCGLAAFRGGRPWQAPCRGRIRPRSLAEVTPTGIAPWAQRP